MRDNVRDTAITVTARKYDGGLHLEWTARLLPAGDDLILTYAPPGAMLVHHTKGLRPHDWSCWAKKVSTEWLRARWSASGCRFARNGLFGTVANWR